ncbi:MAG: preprotein translocase subunit TatB [Micromonosporaceae bacterium]|nr:preprotein translocase subunit TatB [Micromonosporaceae bacterium]
MGNLNAWEIIVLVLLALFLLGPERLPKLVSDVVRLLRRLRAMAREATDGLSRELGTQVTLEDLNPKTFIRKHVFTDEEQAALRRPLDDLSRNLRGIESDIRRAGSDVRGAIEPGAPRRGSDQVSDQPRAPQTDPDAT